MSSPAAATSNPRVLMVCNPTAPRPRRANEWGLMHLLIFGLGYTGSRLAELAARDGVRVTVATRDPSRSGPPGAQLAPFEDPPLETATHLVATAAPGEAGDPVLLRHGPAIAAAPLRWIGYLSTTGVYGDR